MNLPRTWTALTGRDSEVDRILSASMGFDAHVRKPIGRARLHLLELEAGPAKRAEASCANERTALSVPMIQQCANLLHQVQRAQWLSTMRVEAGSNGLIAILAPGERRKRNSG